MKSKDRMVPGTMSSQEPAFVLAALGCNLVSFAAGVCTLTSAQCRYPCLSGAYIPEVATQPEARVLNREISCGTDRALSIRFISNFSINNHICPFSSSTPTTIMAASSAAALLYSEFTQHWRTLGQDDFGCGLPGYYSSNMSVTCLGRDIYLAARKICDKPGVLKPDMDAATLKRMRKALKDDVLKDMLKGYGPLIWANEGRAERAKDNLVEELFGSEEDSTKLLWSEEDDRLI